MGTVREGALKMQYLGEELSKMVVLGGGMMAL